MRHHHTTTTTTGPGSTWSPFLRKLVFRAYLPGFRELFFFVMMIHVFLIYFSLIKYTVLGFLKTRVCFFGCYHVSRGFSLAWLLTFTKSFASIACQSRSWFVSYQNTKRRRKAEKQKSLRCFLIGEVI